MLFCLVSWAGNKTSCFAYWTGSGMLAFGWWAGVSMFFHEEKGACQNDMKRFSLQLYCFVWWTGTERFVLLNGLVPECSGLVHGKELTVPKGWNSWLPTWNHRLLLQGTAGSQRLELLASNLGTMGYHCKQLPVPKNWSDSSQPGNHRLPLQRTSGS